MPATAASPVRRTQEERSAATQRALLDAAVDCLIEQGYQGFRPTAVAERAGVSRGAQLHHYPTRAALVAAAVAHVFAGLTDLYRRRFAALPESGRSAARAVALLREVCLEPRHFAVLDLYAAARTDAELRDCLVPVAARHRANVMELAGRYFPEAAGEKDFQLTLHLLLHAVVGMALSHGFQGPDERSTELAGLLEKLATEAAGDGGKRAGKPRPRLLAAGAAARTPARKKR